MRLVPREQDKLMLHYAGVLARCLLYTSDAADD